MHQYTGQQQQIAAASAGATQPALGAPPSGVSPTPTKQDLHAAALLGGIDSLLADLSSDEDDEFSFSRQTGA